MVGRRREGGREGGGSGMVHQGGRKEKEKKPSGASPIMSVIYLFIYT